MKPRLQFRQRDHEGKNWKRCAETLSEKRLSDVHCQKGVKQFQCVKDTVFWNILNVTSQGRKPCKNKLTRKGYNLVLKE